MSVEGVRGYRDPLYNPRCETDSVRCGPRSSIGVHGNTIETPNYQITATNSGHGTVTVRDKQSGKVVWVGGDPHLGTSDGDYTSFQDGNLTLNLPDGTKVTFDPTEKKNGVSYLERAVITNGNDAAVVGFDDGGNPTTRALPGWGLRLDSRTRDGLDLFAKHGSIDDLKIEGGPEIRGRDIDNLDVYRPGDGFGSGRPHIGLPNWRCDGPFNGWPRHASGPRWADDCRSPGDRRDSGWRIRDLMDQLRTARWQASHGPWHVRDDARRDIRHIERRLRALTA